MRRATVALGDDIEASIVTTYAGTPDPATTRSPLQRRLLRSASCAPRRPQADALELRRPPMVPEIVLLLADDPMLLWARLEAEARTHLPAPYWATAWSGGQAVARYVLDHPGLVAGRRVVDLAAGSGLVAVAAALAGASQVTANDIDPYAIAAIEANATANDVRIRADDRDLTGGDGGDAEVLLAGDCLYTPEVAARMLPYAERAAARGVTVLLGDPGRGFAPPGRLETLAIYHLPELGAAEYGRHDQVSVLCPTPGPRAGDRPALAEGRPDVSG
jgi:predicted nicotinamide N-methyase